MDTAVLSSHRQRRNRSRCHGRKHTVKPAGRHLPTGMTGLIHWRSECATVRAAECVGMRAVISTTSSYTVEEIADATSENHFFRLYPWTSVRTGERR
ncbi:alpha-hydroxy-acid oxidizing protein [Rhodococcus sp. OK302]|uniref:alpha-hydroxy-acid oxidizing protein n=1 Tax=Rhodococcus sp. OK302 TaxID=1882769 RepID=UPI0034E882F0